MFQRLVKLLVLVPVVLPVVMVVPAIAEEMQCGQEYISDDQIEPLTQEQVVEKCGEPTSKEGFLWLYEEQRKTLKFDAEGKLEAIRDAGE